MPISGKTVTNTKFTNQLKVSNTNIGQYVKEYSVLKSMQVKDGATNVNGTTTYNKIGYKRKIQLTTNYLTGTQLYALNSLLNSFYFTLAYWDPYTKTTRTSNVYITDLTAELYQLYIDGYTDDDIIYKPMNITFIETECTNNG